MLETIFLLQILH